MGPMLIPMIMAGDARQDKSLKDFFTGTSAEFKARSLRAHKRRDLTVSVRIGAERCYTSNLSWGGAFIADAYPEKFSPGQELALTFLMGTDAELVIQCIVIRIVPWGEHRPPGIGVQFTQVDPEAEKGLFALLKTDRDTDRDRLPT